MPHSFLDSCQHFEKVLRFSQWCNWGLVSAVTQCIIRKNNRIFMLNELITATFRRQKYYSPAMEEGSRSIWKAYPSTPKMDAAGSSETFMTFSQITGHYPSILKTQTVCSSQTLVNLWLHSCHIPEDDNQHSHSHLCDNLRFQSRWLLL